MLLRITDLINSVIREEEPSVTLSPEEVIGLIGEPCASRLACC